MVASRRRNRRLNVLTSADRAAVDLGNDISLMQRGARRRGIRRDGHNPKARLHRHSRNPQNLIRRCGDRRTRSEPNRDPPGRICY